MNVDLVKGTQAGYCIIKIPQWQYGPTVALYQTVRPPSAGIPSPRTHNIEKCRMDLKTQNSAVSLVWLWASRELRKFGLRIVYSSSSQVAVIAFAFAFDATDLPY